MKTVYFYVLKDPRTNDIRYVGRSINPSNRYKQHIKSANNKGSKNKKECWIKSLLNLELKPLMEIVDSISDYEDIQIVKDIETLLIKKYNEIFNLTNGRDVVDNGYQFSESARLNMSNSQLGNSNRKGKLATEETKKKISDSTKGIKKSKNWFDKVSKSIIQYDKEFNFIREWPSCSSASKELNISQRNISTVANINPKRKTAGGYIWRYK